MEPHLSPLQRALIAGLKGYKCCISPLLGQNCRFYPSCSNYAMEAIKVHGAAIGGWLTVKRIIKCNPLHPGGIDPVPEKPSKETE
ncbi:membrane protein insertion efficiency factor YidD [Bowmanella sp. JS7-9]|uniref:Putative membrane protein insertion efficiency factor n=1 Tax=Pseudobowmanella zhangzhouensis TaxID=1537679 RepID=A0ABW1XQL5_9ALTE|nr:membrane protein insertion efficiency factor YidD [Bowmanella sp. JS7-9]